MAAKKADDSYIPSSAKESGFVMNSEICMARVARVGDELLTIGEMNGIQFRKFVHAALRQHYANRKEGERNCAAAWEAIRKDLVVCDEAAKWWAVLELLHLNKKLPLFADENEKQALSWVKLISKRYLDK